MGLNFLGLRGDIVKRYRDFIGQFAVRHELQHEIQRMRNRLANRDWLSIFAAEHEATAAAWRFCIETDSAGSLARLYWRPLAAMQSLLCTFGTAAYFVVVPFCVVVGTAIFLLFVESQIAIMRVSAIIIIGCLALLIWRAGR